MPVGRLILGSLALASVVACAGLGLGFQTRESSGVPLLEFQNVRFDGTNLTGRVLVGADGGAITVDARLTPHAIVNVEQVADCATGQPTRYLLADSFIPPPREADLITLLEGHWYGADVSFLIFDETIIGQPSPECLLATVVYWPPSHDPDRDVVTPAKVIVRVERTGASESLPPVADGDGDAGVKHDGGVK